MSRSFIVAGAQLGPIAKEETRPSVVARLCAMMREAKARGAELVVFPELALTTFFPRWWPENQDEIDRWFETEMPGPDTQPLFDLAVELGIGFHLGYAELTPEGRHFNTAILVGPDGAILGKYRKIHLPGHRDRQDWRPFQHLEKYYFEKGDLGFPAFDAFGGKLGMCICNDRRWPETWRMLGLNGAELVVLGYNTPLHYPPAPEHDHLQYFHNELSIQAGCYQNGLWAVAVAKAGFEEGCELIAGSIIVAPTGEVLARTQGSDDEVITARIDLDRCSEIRRNVFDFAQHREPEEYRKIAER
ncbi:MAG: N-carbamoyl-D-amino-acid hydrolase [Rhodobacteraceae bacterium]|uniref:N-carbamoyl-D-amino-acid hydrolase n=1 Tax=Thioclava marina TaxID=1915077 RepID=A0ABX3MI92_9RHOB|nr:MULTISPECIES: N-carbamoyl-D-amino-acid hydrolase [Thioclava]MBD3803199.1 N-carbamoyl-D-amino-acid hydrolase [Thioclava sp.]OOY11286.1 N-carbamoyl-D-amino-acid hydrolase [Thioclava marina]TNF14993.1 MAG: N-carbamoyl-D-amino-acid hydrolase [Paracoccaceae bacterium]